MGLLSKLKAEDEAKRAQQLAANESAELRKLQTDHEFCDWLSRGNRITNINQLESLEFLRHLKKEHQAYKDAETANRPKGNYSKSGPKAIETSYKGYRFRSRLEARWAVCFDALGIDWKYELEGYELNLGDWYGNRPNGITIQGSQRYLPDFWLPQVKMFVEVKPQWPSPNELALIAVLSELSGHSVLILDDVPSAKSYFGISGLSFDHGAWDYDIHEFDIFGDDHEYWKTEGRFYHVSHAQFYDWSQRPICDDLFDDSFSHNAIAIARSARFEHGESPRF